MNFLHAEIGSAKDNFKCPVHNWYKFTAGFSHKFVDEIIQQDNLKTRRNSKIFDPFAGCGTTLVSSQKTGVPAVGNEGQKFMYDVIRAKLNWRLDETEFENHLADIKDFVFSSIADFDYNDTPHPLLKTLYTKGALARLYLIKESIANIDSWKYRLFFNLALSQTLHKVPKHPIAIPYIVRSKTLTSTTKTWYFFENIARQMIDDTSDLSDLGHTSKIYLHDSRKENEEINDGECNSCITSPPYLNNLDYGEISKVHTHFFDLTEDWNDITTRVRKKLVTGATTHYKLSDFDLDTFRQSEFYLENRSLMSDLMRVRASLEQVSEGRKSFDVLAVFYFRDMYEVLKEIRRVLRPGSCAYLIMGDSAPYGIRIPTTKFLGRMAKNAGFDSYSIRKIRTRGTKWTTLTHRHNLELKENVLILR